MCIRDSIDNGMIVKLDSLLPNERELWKALTPEAVSYTHLDVYKRQA